MAKKIERLEDLTPDAHNANRGTERGHAQLDRSLRDYGAGRSILADKEGRVIAGNKTLQAAVEAGLRARVVETTGDELVVVVRKDLSLEEERARELAYADNVIAQNDLAWDREIIQADLEAGLKLEKFFLKDELGDILNKDDESEGDEGDPDECRVILSMTPEQHAEWNDLLIQRCKEHHMTGVEVVLKALRDMK